MYWFSENGEIASEAQTWPKTFSFLRQALHSAIARGQHTSSNEYTFERKKEKKER